MSYSLFFFPILCYSTIVWLIVNRLLEKVIKLEDNNLVLPSQTVFQFSKPFAQYDGSVAPEKKEIRITLYYEPKLFFNKKHMLENNRNWGNYLTPDIYIEIKAPKRKYGLENFSAILDAKFKNYDNLNLSYWLSRPHNDLKEIKYFQDIMHTAMFKYHYRLQEFFIRGSDDLKNQVGLSVILNPNYKCLWQGEIPLVSCDFLENEREQVNQIFNNFPSLNMPNYRNFVSHKFGSLTLRPQSIAEDIRRLFTIIFHYHIGLTSLCLHCGRELHNREEFYDNKDNSDLAANDVSDNITKQDSDSYWKNHDPGASFRAICQKCETEWRISFCHHCGSNESNKKVEIYQPSSDNRIVKLGRDYKTATWLSIHDRLDKDTFCPSCGKRQDGKIKADVLENRKKSLADISFATQKSFFSSNDSHYS